MPNISYMIAFMNKSIMSSHNLCIGQLFFSALD